MLARQQPQHLPHPYRKLLVALEWRVMKSLLGQLTTTVGCWVLLYSWYYPQTLFRVLDRQQVLWPTFHVGTRRRLDRRIPAEILDPCGYMGMVCFTFATRHLVVVCTQTCIFRLCIVSRHLYADCMRCCIPVAVMLWYHVKTRDIWLRHMSRWVWYVLRPRVWTEMFRSKTVPHIGSYNLVWEPYRT